MSQGISVSGVDQSNALKATLFFKNKTKTLTDLLCDSSVLEFFRPNDREATLLYVFYCIFSEFSNITVLCCALMRLSISVSQTMTRL